MVEVYQPSGYWGFYQLNVTEVESTGLTAFFLNISRTIEIEQSAFPSAMTNNVWLRFLIELVAFASFIASMIQNNFWSIFLKNAQLLHCEE